MLAWNIGEPSVDSQRGVRSAICKPPSGGVIELVSVDNPQQPFAKSIAEFLDTHREGMYALVLQSRDLQATATALATRGLMTTAATDSAEVLEIDRSSAFGALLRIESA